MSTLWTPDGERPIRRADEPAAPSPSTSAPGEPSEEELMAQMMEMQRQLAAAPAEVVIANHAYAMFELARLHLSLDPPQLAQARIAIDAYAALVEGMAGRLGENEAELVEALGNLRMAFVQVSSGSEPGGDPEA